MKLEPIHGMDYFRVLLSEAYHGGKPIYNKQGEVIPLNEIANTTFGRLLIGFDAGEYCTENLTKG